MKNFYSSAHFFSHFIASSFFLIMFSCQDVQSQGLYKKVDELIMPLVDTKNYSGTVLVSKDGNVLVNKGYGLANIENNVACGPETKFFLASASMPFTAAGIMLLVDKGLIALEDKVSIYIPDYVHGDKITIHDLLAQRSGIPAIGVEDNVDYGEMTRSKQTPESLYAYFKGYKLLFEPGAEYNHGRSDYILLALIVEKITRPPFGEFLQKEIFQPLQMVNTGHYSGYEDIVMNLARGYAPINLFDVERAFPLDWSSKTGHASIYSTGEDLQKFGQAIINGELLSKKSWRAIFTNYGDEVGYGWFVRDHGSHTRVQMNGRSPGFSSYLGIYPKDNVIVVMLSNRYISLPADMGKPLASIVFDEPYESLKLSPDKLSEERLERLIGSYQFGETFYRPNFKMTIESKNGYLYSDWGGLIPVISDGSEKFIIRTYWLNTEFVENERGEITNILVDGFKGVKVK